MLSLDVCVCTEITQLIDPKTAWNVAIAYRGKLFNSKQSNERNLFLRCSKSELLINSEVLWRCCERLWNLWFKLLSLIVSIRCLWSWWSQASVKIWNYRKFASCFLRLEVSSDSMFDSLSSIHSFSFPVRLPADGHLQLIGCDYFIVKHFNHRFSKFFILCDPSNRRFKHLLSSSMKFSYKYLIKCYLPSS